ncbi:nucleotidyltransferase family protein [Candidatus Sumerlaeota bacterium]|nr:nucleotidyltransferase family protein [Candidatus Sumerlaeota bacterium]
MKREAVIELIRGRQDELRHRFGVKELSLFGSCARDEAGIVSDIDLLVDFENPATFDGYMNLKFHLEDILGRLVDLVTRKALRKELKTDIERQAVHVA